MTTSNTHPPKTPKHPAHSAHPSIAAVPAESPPEADASAQATTSAAASTVASATSFPAPPALDSVQKAPTGFLAAAKVSYRGVLPYQGEADSIDAAVKDLQRITNPAIFVGAPAIGQFIQMLILAGQWTAVRNASFSWDQYASTQEGAVWARARSMVNDFRAAFLQAEKADPTLPTQYPGLTTFLGARSAVAQKGASTKRANKKAEAEGKPAQHGRVGKKRQRAAEKAALAAQQAQAEAAGAPSPAPAPSAQPAPPAGPTNGTSR